ncbi:hypothetical protein [Microvirga zambiensis]|uniref:hypothetical protein n=1 Tax=Microvirga zambiensis TaxID=1402137 RepID=UPI00191FE89B|nr:hypothetical protein [Microvirga zambiensis]
MRKSDFDLLDLCKNKKVIEWYCVRVASAALFIALKDVPSTAAFRRIANPAAQP